MIQRRLIAGRGALSAASILAALVAVGCVAAPGSSAGPSTTPSVTTAPTPVPTPLPTTPPSPSPTAPPSASPSASPSAVPSTTACGVATWQQGAKDVVLRVTVAGGFVPPGVDLTNVPVVTIFGDGTVISQGAQIMIYPGPLLPALQVQKLSDAGMRKVLDAAAAAGLLVADTTYQAGGIADAPTTFFTLNADGCTHHVNAYALSESTSDPNADKGTLDARAALLAFLNKVTDLPTLAGAANVTDGGVYTATSYRIVVRDEPSAGTGSNGSPAPVVKWPLAAPLATFGEPLGAGMTDTRCGVVDGADAATLTPVFAKANAETHFSSGGKSYYLRVRPLLPDETGCGDPIV